MIINSDRPLVTIVTPVYNQVNHIETTIRSVLSQDYPNIEYIIVDGVSNDGTLDIVNKFKDRVKIISEIDMGQSDAINKGFRLAKGDILNWLNADDIFYPEAINRVVNKFIEDSSIKILYGDCTYIDLDGTSITQYPTKPFDFSTLLNKIDNFIPQPSTFFRRELYLEIGDIRTDLQYILDFEYWIRVGQRFPFHYLPAMISGARLHPAAKSIAGIGNFGYELVQIYENLSKMKNEDLRVSAEVLGRAYLKGSHASYWGGDLFQSWTFLRKSFQLNKQLIISKSAIFLLLLNFASRRTRIPINRLFSNPYLKGTLNNG